MMRNTHYVSLLVFLAAALAPPACHSQVSYPEWRARRIGLEGNWVQAETVVVGEVNDAKLLGPQTLEQPAPAAPGIRVIYWCQAKLETVTVLKGKAPTEGKNLLWAGVRPDCAEGILPSYGYYMVTAPPATRVWFLREEGEYLRPVVDGGVFNVSFHVSWANVPPERARATFARLLLEPAAGGISSRQFAGTAADVLEVAGSILEQEEVIARLRALGKHPDEQVRQEACHLLKAAYEKECP
jgi:hypothetical protein